MTSEPATKHHPHCPRLVFISLRILVYHASELGHPNNMNQILFPKQDFFLSKDKDDSRIIRPWSDHDPTSDYPRITSFPSRKALKSFSPHQQISSVISNTFENIRVSLHGPQQKYTEFSVLSLPTSQYQHCHKRGTTISIASLNSCFLNKCQAICFWTRSFLEAKTFACIFHEH